jgi:tetratricopeptide (TPR) repeat protein
MRRSGLVATWALLAGACAPTAQERVRDFNDDGVVLFQRGDYAHAREIFQAALALKPGDPSLMYNVGQCHERLGQVAAAENAYNECLVRSPQHTDCRFALASLLVRQGRRPDAVRMTEDWLAHEPKRSGAYALDGWLWHQYGDLPQAQSRLQQALALDPNDHIALTELGRVYEELHRPDRAAALYERSLDLRPNQSEIRDRLTSLQRQGAGRPHPD